MGRHLKKDEWSEVFNVYEQYIKYYITKKELISKYIQMTNKNILYWNTTFRLIKTKFNARKQCEVQYYVSYYFLALFHILS